MLSEFLSSLNTFRVVIVHRGGDYRFALGRLFRICEFPVLTKNSLFFKIFSLLDPVGN
jgi:hypothetical protein